MCGIAGYWVRRPIERDGAVCQGLKMARAMRHRGPDNQGVWVDPFAGLVLSHARLSVIDLSQAAHQPFVSRDGRFVIIYNGEIYNFSELRNNLKEDGYTFSTVSDTEVILNACRRWGVVEAAKRFIGMFAFAIWDNGAKRLSLVRDPIGIKPLYYGRQSETFLFSSTLTAFHKHPAFEGRISADALAAYFRYSYVPSSHSIFEGIHKLLPGHVLSIDLNGREELECYWDSLEVARKGLAEPFDFPDSELIDAFESLARDSVQRCLVSDVPLGAFLSGGIDSSLVVALMQANGERRAKTFTVGFSDARFDESRYAREVATHLGCDHTEIVCSTSEAAAFIPDLPTYYDEPFADSSQIPTLLLSKLTRQSVTVALSGDGGDELFGGYDRYYWMEKLKKAQMFRPRALQQWLMRLSDRLPRPLIFPALQKLPKGSSIIPLVDGYYHLARMVSRADDFRYLYQTTPMTVCAHRDCPLLAHEKEPPSILDDESVRQSLPDVLLWMQYVDQQTYLPEDILQKVDRASMAFSLETRVPLLDHRLIEFAWKTPPHMKLFRGRGKIIMREVLARHIPKHLIERPKRGFSIPLSDWLKGDLRDWAESLVYSQKTREDPLLDHAGVQATWKNFLSGRAEHTLTTLWSLLMYLQWNHYPYASANVAPVSQPIPAKDTCRIHI